jgi:hypothetical protein
MIKTRLTQPFEMWTLNTHRPNIGEVLEFYKEKSAVLFKGKNAVYGENQSKQVHKSCGMKCRGFNIK